MVTIVYPEGLRQAHLGTVNLLSDTIQVAMLMSNTDCDTLVDATTLSSFSLDEMNGANYVRKTIGSKTLVVDAGNDRLKFDSTADITWTALGAGTRQVVGVLVYKFITNDASSIPICFTDSGANFPFTANGGDITLTWNGLGIMLLNAA